MAVPSAAASAPASRVASVGKARQAGLAASEDGRSLVDDVVVFYAMHGLARRLGNSAVCAEHPRQHRGWAARSRRQRGLVTASRSVSRSRSESVASNPIPPLVGADRQPTGAIPGLGDLDRLRLA